MKQDGKGYDGIEGNGVECDGKGSSLSLKKWEKEKEEEGEGDGRKLQCRGKD